MKNSWTVFVGKISGNQNMEKLESSEEDDDEDDFQKLRNAETPDVDEENILFMNQRFTKHFVAVFLFSSLISSEH